MGKMSIVVAAMLLVWTGCQAHSQPVSAPSKVDATPPAPAKQEPFWCAELIDGPLGGCTRTLAGCQSYRAGLAERTQQVTECTPRTTAYCLSRRRADGAIVADCTPALYMCRAFRDRMIAFPGRGVPINDCTEYATEPVPGPVTSDSAASGPRWWCTASVDGTKAFCWRGLPQCQGDRARREHIGMAMQECAARDVAYCLATKGPESSSPWCFASLAICTAFRDFASAHPDGPTPISDCAEWR